MNIIKLYKLSNYFYNKKIILLPKLIKYIIRIIYACYLPYKCQIGEGTIFYHGGLGVTIHEDTIIGNNCHVFTCVTLGGTNNKEIKIYIGDNVMIGTGAKIIGNIKIGNNVVIAANSVVLSDIPSNCMVAGVPAEIKKKNININEYI